jgi:hypothetical protein
MLRQETHHDAEDNTAPHREDTLWIIAGVVVTLSMVAVVYIGLTL